ncbi:MULTISPECIES: hypothetical protein [unclassified Mesorhizobium]|uniref:relaxase/mobilization nuclease domain-containing protein n=1 Tax=unclassified Mesorhizobium TaxID=325217 RepID=UPI000FCB26C4|nr:MULTISPECIES: hypothetical protein [unclassified Mesorhizobium]TGP21399.1 hypothetical protein EN874_023910 [Mesorhizobium sp. M1D.F.Ca.ET.231.01.1.1]TGP28845.1 hypothetical protein EN877_22290 [Mesorhizobium sp. M1D.F.Ca.ET.234.01.1.1]TGS43313.1 hypothetical protein EN827_22285 [Mesorhizobium sp. M1D.F.Ca.ET.184.01.1.1]TGS59862.1 hypothetical protein EN826_022285 [Mesorhizobium sp. M1D.F.Ca.ET.183.01.1.1]
MEFFLGAFERDWERRRAALLHELQMGEHEDLDWDRPRRGGVAHLPAGVGGWGGARRQGRAVAFRGTGGGRPMHARFAALARGSQPAVVKLASYGGGIRAAAMMSYASRSGELPVENEKGERIIGKQALAELRGDWEHLFDNRTASRDVGMFQASITAASVAGMDDREEFAREALRAGFGERRFVYAIEEKKADELEVRGVVVLRDPGGERLTADAKATAIVQERVDNSDVGREAKVRFRFRGYGNGVEFATARVRDLVERMQQGGVRDETARIVGDFEKAGDLVQKEWRRELHSRKGRDVMHLIVSARAGTDVTAFQAAVRDFLGEQFGGHRYVFALHDPADDPKEMGQGGQRPHVHAHAIVTMRSETGDRIVTSPQIFRQWRALMAEKAREHDIDMEMTDRREFGNPPAYARNQVRPVSYAGRTEHEGTSRAAQVRYDRKRTNQRSAARSPSSTDYAVEAVQAWDEVMRGRPEKAVADFATEQIDRLQTALGESQIDIGKFENSHNATNLKANMIELEKLVAAGGLPMHSMTRMEFEAYEKRVEAVLATVEAAIEPVEKKDFDEIAATAREVVEIRREYLELSEREAQAERLEAAPQGQGERDAPRPPQDAVKFQMAERAGADGAVEGKVKDNPDQRRFDSEARVSRDDLFDSAIARHGERAVREGDEILAGYDAAAQSLERATTRFSNEYSGSDLSDDERATIRADYLAASSRYDAVLQRYAREALDGNTYLYEQSKGEENLQKALKEEAQHRASQRAIDMYDPTRNLPARQHDEQMVRAGDELFARIDAARIAAYRLHEPENRDSRSPASSLAETEAERDARIAKLSEAEIRYADLLREAARAAIDGNGYIRDMATIRHDLNNEIHMESRRRAEAEQERDDNVRVTSGRSEPGSRAARLNEEYRADPPQQQVPRLRELEREVEQRHDRERSEQER